MLTVQIGGLKKKIQEAQSFPAELQKLIYSGGYQCSAQTNIPGKILKDDATVGDLKIKEKDFLVVMVSKVSHVVYTDNRARLTFPAQGHSRRRCRVIVDSCCRRSRPCFVLPRPCCFGSRRLHPRRGVDARCRRDDFDDRVCRGCFG